MREIPTIGGAYTVPDKSKHPYSHNDATISPAVNKGFENSAGGVIASAGRRQWTTRRAAAGGISTSRSTKMRQSVATRHGVPTAVRQRSCRYLVRRLQAPGSTGTAYRSSRGLLGAWRTKWTRPWVLVSSRGSPNILKYGLLAAVDRGEPSLGPKLRARCAAEDAGPRHPSQGENIQQFINL